MPTPSLSPSSFLQVVGDPLRWRLLEELARSDRRVNELVLLTGKPQNLVSYHLRELRTAGLVSARRSSADGRDTYYRLEAAQCATGFGAAAAALGATLEPGVGPVRPRRGSRVLFLCTGNSARSQMAEALVQARSAGAIHARSAGSHPKALNPLAVRAMAARGLDISGRPTKHYGQFARTRFDLVITLCDKVREICPEFPGAPVTAHWSMPDPAAADDGYAAFVRTAEEIDERLTRLVDTGTTEPQPQRRAHAHR